jgi:GNAT superfamily N-acetyltransferase
MAHLMATVRAATPEDAATVGDVLASAFSTDPLWRWVTSERGADPRRLRPIFTAMARINLRRADGEVLVTGDADGAAIWYPPKRWRLQGTENLRLAPGALRTFGRSVRRGMQVGQATEQAHPAEPHWYLDLLGVRTDRQRKGIGSAVLTPVLERCDAGGVPAYLAASEGAVSLYARHGFVERGAIGMPSGCPPLVPMWREPR